MKTTVSTKGQITLPAKLREQDAIRPGDEFEIKRIRNGHYLLEAVTSKGSSGLVRWLRECPVQGWFQAVESDVYDHDT